MQLSTRTRYGMRAMLELAMHYEEERLPLKKIAQRQGVSERYLENIMRELASSGLINSSRGKKGGFRLAKPPGKIHLDEIVRVVEGPLAPVFCVDRPELCKKSPVCVTHEVWHKMKKAIEATLHSLTLKNLLNMQKKKTGTKDTYMYHI